ncbi:hypothetical protein K501DRAFT_270061 [Backusella circina FSU 941]|nr:hypothetical protein K501DRAFT_270061 [Backusella circina FSU 941]
MKQGETANPYTTKRKQIHYPTHEKVKGIKIDAQLLLDYNKNKINLCNGEVAIKSKDTNKIAYDSTKCLREAKAIVDHHIQKTFRFPQNVSELNGFISTLKYLEFLIQKSNEAEVIEFTELYDKVSRAHTPSLNDDSDHRNNSYDTSMITKSSNYTPPSGTRSESFISSELFGKGKRRLFTEKVFNGESSSLAFRVK